MRTFHPEVPAQTGRRLIDLIAPRDAGRLTALRRAWEQTPPDDRLRFFTEILTEEERQRYMTGLLKSELQE